jgi:hypothetical protein
MNYGCVFYKAIIRLTGTYGAQSWTLTNAMEGDLAREREMLRKMCGPVYGTVCVIVEINQQIYNRYESSEIVTVIKGIRWNGVSML